MYNSIMISQEQRHSIYYVYIKMIYVYTMHIQVFVWYMLWIYKYTSICVYIHGIYMVYTMNIIVYWMSPFLADHDAIVHEWSKSLNFQFTFNVQRCPADLEFLGIYAHRHSWTLRRREGVRILRRMANSSHIPCIEQPYNMYIVGIWSVYAILLRILTPSRRRNVQLCLWA